MGFNLKQVVIAGESTSLTDTGKTVKPSDLSKEELEYLLTLLKNVDLKGYQIEMFYSMIIKLQNQYVSINK
jgi:hypothetical protein